MQSDAKTSAEYAVRTGKPARREASLPSAASSSTTCRHGYDEVMQYGMISYIVPLSVIPDTYNGKPLMYIALASQKHYMSLYLTTVYADQSLSDWFKQRYLATGKKLNMGKSCVPFPQARRPAPRPGRRGAPPSHLSRPNSSKRPSPQISLEPQIAYSQGNFASNWDKPT